MMKTMTQLFTVGAILTALSVPVFADDRGPIRQKSPEEYNELFDRAFKAAQDQAARIRERQETSPVTAPMFQEKNLRAAPTVDPDAIASRYPDFKKAALPPADDLLIFVSSSLPIETLKRLGTQAKIAGGVLVFRGMAGDIGNKNDRMRWLQYLEPLVKTGADVQIDPRPFREFAISRVPSFVLAKRGEGCAVTEQCRLESLAVVGDVSLDYALEHMAKQPGRVAGIAKERLARFERRQP